MKTAIIIAYKNREAYLKILLEHLPKYLNNNHPKIKYDIIVSEQLDDTVFNKSISLNTGIKYCYKKLNSEHIIIHNVDIVPVSNVNYNYRNSCLVWFTDAAGINCLLSDFLTVNGYDNTYCGWGGEDVDIIKRFDFYKIKMIDWKILAQNEKPTLANLEWLGFNSQYESKRYWGYDWPRFLTLEEYNLPIITIDKQHNWYQQKYVLANDDRLKKYSSLNDDLRNNHYQNSGLNQIRLDKLENIQINYNYHKISYSTHNIIENN